nr:putative cell-to-cell movement protein [Paris yunnanensis betanucleorhabdovirus 1]
MAHTPSTMKEESYNKSSDCVVFHSAPITGSCGEIRVKKQDMTLSSKMKAMFWSCISSQGISLNVTKFVARWCPSIEPTSETTLKLTLAYDILDDNTDLMDKSTLLTLTGRMSEVHQITWYPSRPMIYTKSAHMRFPWSLKIDTGDIDQQPGSPILGVIKMWCHVEIGPYSTSKRTKSRMHTPPHIEWENRNFPFYVPIWCQRQARGITTSAVDKTLQYNRFNHDVMRHVSSGVIPSAEAIPIMQTMTQDDYNELLSLTESCLLSKGGSYCNCGKQVSDLVSGIISNRSSKYNNHTSKIQKYTTNAKSGRYQQVPIIDDVAF